MKIKKETEGKRRKGKSIPHRPRCVERLADEIGVDAVGHLFGEFPEGEGADGAGVLDDFQPAEGVAFGVRQRLALLGVSVAASFFMSRRISSWSLSMMRARAPSRTLRQVLNASAAFTARSTSSAPHIGTRARTCCVAGFTTSRQALALETARP